jgi:tetratricopeptide (TPR) repeat protein
VQAAARLAGVPGIELSALVLQADILLALAGQDRSAGQARRESEQALIQAADRAATLAYGYEQARAYFLLGQAYAGREDLETALQWFERALDIALARQATDLATAIRERTAEAHEQLGDVLASREVLGSMVDQLATEGAEAELVQGLLRQAALHLDLARHDEAISTLHQARSVSDASLARIQVALMLGQAYYETGRFQQAEEQLRSALINPATGVFRRPSPLLPLNNGLGVLANIHRHRGEVAEARRVRQVQSRHLGGAEERARWAFERILDALAAGDLGGAAALLQDAAELLQHSGPPGMAELARLAICAEGARNPRAACPAAEVRQLHAQATDRGRPRLAAAMRWYHCQYLARSGRIRESVDELTGLLSELRFYRSELPGVLGAWYWTRRAEVFAAGLAWPGELVDGGAAESLYLLALARLVDSAARREHPPADELRALIARGDVRAGRELAEARERFAGRTGQVSAAGLERFRAAIGPEEALLALDLGHGSAQAWVMTREGTQRRSLAAAGVFNPPARIHGKGPRASHAAGDAAGVRSMLARLGEALAPLLAGLPPKVYTLGGGNPGGVALEAVQSGGRFLAESHQFPVMAGFPVHDVIARQASFAWPEEAFVAGNPLDWSGDYPAGLQTTAEIRAVIELFVGPGLHIVQGNALLADEFGDQRLAQSRIVHLAMPAEIELADPEKSWLELSEPGRGQGRARLTPADLRQWNLPDAVVFLSRSSMRGAPADRFASRIGLVHDLLDAGALAVIAGRWPVDAEFATRFAASFYAELKRSGDVVDAFATAQRAFLSGAPDGGMDWASYQLYLR